jgi:AraC family transcriptional regulator
MQVRPPLRSRHAEGIDRALAHLSRALAAGGEVPDLAELAAVAHFSPFHFHRVYRALTGETVGRSVARLRLLRALQALDADGSDLAQVSLQAGYASSQALARAFREAFDATPSALRADAGLRQHWIDRLASPPGPPVAESPLQVRVVDLATFEVVALRASGRFDDLDQSFGALFRWASEAGRVDEATRLIGVPRNDLRDSAGESVEFDCALHLSDRPAPPAPMRRLQIEGGPFAVLRHVGDYVGLEDATDLLLARWLDASGRALREAPLHYHYLDDPESVPAPLLRADIHLPLAPD